MAENLYELEDCILALRRMMLEHGGNGLTLSADQVTHLDPWLLDLARRAKLQAHEISRHRWNAEARGDVKAETARIQAELERPGTNVKLFPVIPRPFSDGRGGAA